MVKRVVVVGGGLIGAQVVQKLADADKNKKEYEVTLIDPKSYYENNIGSVRSLVQPEFLKKTTVRHVDWLPKHVQFIQGRATEITPQKVIVDEGRQEVQFDVLVVALGSSYSAFKAGEASPEQRNQAAQAYADRIRRAQSVLVVGGGPTGVEVCGEIAHSYPQKKVTLVHSQPQLISSLPAKAQAKLLTAVQQAGIKLILQDRVVLPEGKENKDENNGQMVQYRTEKGQVIQADMLIVSTGTTINVQPLQRHFGNLVDRHQGIKVGLTLQVEGRDNIFAIGDVANTGEVKLAANSGRHVAALIHNIRRVVGGQNQGLKKIKPGFLNWPAVTTIGPEFGVAAFPFCGALVFASKTWGAQKVKFMTAGPPKFFD